MQFICKRFDGELVCRAVINCVSQIYKLIIVWQLCFLRGDCRIVFFTQSPEKIF